MPSTSAALEAHLKGAGQLFQAYGAEACRVGILHTLFTGFRPLLVRSVGHSNHFQVFN